MRSPATRVGYPFKFSVNDATPFVGEQYKKCTVTLSVETKCARKVALWYDGGVLDYEPSVVFEILWG